MRGFTLRDSILVEKQRDKVNDCEEHEQHHHLQDFLIMTKDDEDEDEVPNPTLTHVDSLVVLNSHNYVNDCEEHEGQPHLKDFFRLKSNDNKQGSEQVEKKSKVSPGRVSAYHKIAKKTTAKSPFMK